MLTRLTLRPRPGAQDQAIALDEVVRLACGTAGGGEGEEIWHYTYRTDVAKREWELRGFTVLSCEELQCGSEDWFEAMLDIGDFETVRLDDSSWWEILTIVDIGEMPVLNTYTVSGDGLPQLLLQLEQTPSRRYVLSGDCLSQLPLPVEELLSGRAESTERLVSVRRIE